VTKPSAVRSKHRRARCDSQSRSVKFVGTRTERCPHTPRVDVRYDLTVRTRTGAKHLHSEHTYLEQRVHRGPRVHASTPRRAAPSRARRFEAHERCQMLEIQNEFLFNIGCPLFQISLRFCPAFARGVSDVNARETRCELRAKRDTVLRVHGGRVVRNQRFVAGASLEEMTMSMTIVERITNRIRMRSEPSDPNPLPNPPIPCSKTHQTNQGRNDVRDAKADVTDMRAMPQTQRVRSKNRAFSLDEENEVSAFLLTDVFKILLSRITDAFPFHRKPWRPWGALERTWKWSPYRGLGRNRGRSDDDFCEELGGGGAGMGRKSFYRSVFTSVLISFPNLEVKNHSGVARSRR
jgi:hypothetical protein